MGIKEDKLRFLGALDSEKTLIFAHIYDLSLQAEKYSSPVYGDFLSMEEQSILTERAHLLPTSPTLFGGFEDAERKMLAFIPSFEEEDFPICAVKIVARKGAKLSHRDYLGGVMALGIKREKCGDIIIQENTAHAFMGKDIARFVESSLLTVGREGVSTSIVSAECVPIPQKSFTTIKGTVKSLRLDSVITLFIGSGRAGATDYIKQGRVFVDGITVEKPDKHVSDGSVITVRGVGRANLTVEGTSRKDRIFITLNKYS